MLCHRSATMLADSSGDRPRLGLLHSGNLHSLEGGEKHGSSSVASRFFCCSGLLLELGEFGEKGLPASCNCGEIIGL